MDATNLYTPIVPCRVIEISQLYTVHYFENHKNYFFAGEYHNFWEIMYVDRGEVIADTDRCSAPIHLEQGDLLIFPPNEFHRTYSNNVTSHNLLVVSFSSPSPAMEFFQTNNLFHIDEEMRQQMGILLYEAKKSYSSESLSCSTMSVHRQADADFGSEQILTMMIEWLLIRLFRNDMNQDRDSSRLASSYVDKAIFFMKQNLRNNICLEDICRYTSISRSQLQKAFQRHMGTSVMHYFTLLRIEEAKFLICTGDKNFTEIAEEFCYCSVHHFSKQFHKIVGMTPTEYAESVIAAMPRYGE